MMAEHSSSSDEKAYLIRNLNQIEDRTEFFELIKKTGSEVKCTADGLSIDDKHPISPRSYNEIGRAVLLDKLNQIEQSKESILHKNLMNQFENEVPAQNREEFERRLEDIKSLPADQQKEAIKQLIVELKDADKLDDQRFNAAWSQVQEGCDTDMDEQMAKIDKFNQAENAKEAFLQKNIMKEFRNEIPRDKQNDFQEEFKEIKLLPADQQKDALQQLLGKLNGVDRLNEERFSSGWGKVEQGCEIDMNKQLAELSKLNELGQAREKFMENNIMKEFKDEVPAQKMNEFKQGWENIKSLPADQQKDATKQLIVDLKTANKLDDQRFNAAWSEVEKGCKTDAQHLLNKAFNPLLEGSNHTGHGEDITRAQELQSKKMFGTITDAEQKELDQTLKKCYRHQKEYLLQTTADHRNDANYDRSMDNLEKQATGGKNLEQLKMAQRDLDTALANQRITEADYQAEKQKIDDGMAKANHFREFRGRADAFLSSGNPNGDATQLQRTFVDDCERALTAARESGDHAAIASAEQKLTMAQEINTQTNATVLDSNREFKQGVLTFSSAQNERLCFNMDADRVRSNLQHIYGQPNVEDISINGKTIFSNMKISDYDRLNRVFNDYGSDANQLMNAATKLAEDHQFLGQVHLKTPHDMASITEALDIAVVHFT